MELSQSHRGQSFRDTVQLCIAIVVIVCCVECFVSVASYSWVGGQERDTESGVILSNARRAEMMKYDILVCTNIYSYYGRFGKAQSSVHSASWDRAGYVEDTAPEILNICVLLLLSFCPPSTFLDLTRLMGGEVLNSSLIHCKYSLVKNTWYKAVLQ